MKKIELEIENRNKKSLLGLENMKIPNQQNKKPKKELYFEILSEFW